MIGPRWSQAISVMVALCSCAGQRSTTPTPTVIPIKVISWPSRPVVTCYVADLPPAPEVTTWPEGESDVVRRTMVSKREYDDLLNYVRDLGHAYGTARSCLQEVMTGGVGR